MHYNVYATIIILSCMNTDLNHNGYSSYENLHQRKLPAIRYTIIMWYNISQNAIQFLRSGSSGLNEALLSNPIIKSSLVIIIDVYHYIYYSLVALCMYMWYIIRLNLKCNPEVFSIVSVSIIYTIYTMH